MSDSSSAYGKGFAVRMIVLLLLLGLVTFGLYYDRMVLPQQANQTIEKVLELVDVETDDGKGLPKDRVHETFGFAPAETREEGSYEVETYRFKRALPFLEGGQFVEVAYINGALYQIEINSKFDPQKQSDLMDGVTMMPAEERTMPASSMGGGGGGGGGARTRDPGQIVTRIMRSDKDEDGKISKDEASDRMKSRFDDMDEDGDGFLTKEEVEKAINSAVNSDDQTVDIGAGRPSPDSGESKDDDKKSTDADKEEAKKDESKKDESKDGESKEQSEDKSGDDKSDDKSGD